MPMRYDPQDELEVPSRTLKTLRITAKEIDMGNRPVEGMTGKWYPKEFHDTYHEDLMALIDKRIKAGKTQTVDEPSRRRRNAKKALIDLMALLKKSVERRGRGHSRHKAQRTTHHGKRKAA
jgi:DNA end-binding protein Ku